MDNGYTTNDFRTGNADSGKFGDDVGMFLPHQVHYRSAYDADDTEVSILNGYSYKADRSTETNTA